MAYLQPSKWDEEQQQQQAATSAQPSLGSAPAPAVAASSGPAPAPAAKPGPAYPNISAYLGANDAQGKDMGQQIDQKIGGEVNDAQTQFDQGKADWQAQNQNTANDWTRNYAETLGANKTAQDKYNAAAAAGQAAATNALPPGMRSDAKVTTLTPPPAPQQLPAAPTFADYSPWAGGLQSGHDAQSQIQALGNDSGRAALLQQMAGPGYTPGMAAMDSAIVGNSLPTIGADMGSKYGGILSALQGSVAAPGAPPTPTGIIRTNSPTQKPEQDPTLYPTGKGKRYTNG